jgi:hypothetical protein
MEWTNADLAAVGGQLVRSLVFAKGQGTSTE